MEKLLKPVLTRTVMSIPLDLSRGCDSGFVFRGIVYAEGKTTTTVFDGLMESHVFLIDYP